MEGSEEIKDQQHHSNGHSYPVPADFDAIDILDDTRIEKDHVCVSHNYKVSPLIHCNT